MAYMHHGFGLFVVGQAALCGHANNQIMVGIEINTLVKVAPDPGAGVNENDATVIQPMGFNTIKRGVAGKALAGIFA